jgi:hypothetical protein
VTLICQASDPDDDVLTYDWAASGGSITGEGASVTCHAPDTPGDQTIKVIVQDEHGGEVEGSILVQVISAQPPSGMSEPSGVFGQIWREHQLRRTLGWATAGERRLLLRSSFSSGASCFGGAIRTKFMG